MYRSLFAAFCIAVLAVSTANAQSSEGISLDSDGQFVGKAFVTGEETPVEAKITLAKDGVVVDSVKAQEDGSFSFANVEPGTYNMYGSSANYIGAQTVDVLPYSGGGGGCSSCDFGMNNYSTASYDTYASAPVSACSSCSPCGGCGGGRLFGGRLLGGGGFGGGGGLFGGGGGGLFGGGGGGLFGGSRLLRLGAIGGVIAIASSSPDS